ncbi:phosphotransferase family protein [Sneathiella sp. CAU 1612]|uniref:Phosphotransferase family protein n=2 Tax=Sneathiella sedimenti TaxID=2816034 RepID=A0ABS3F8T8_9PROT|nr:phosphotransferase family protein [Sneathiella sedimenti]MBO0334742.1 phosphotransferase family protein [Sneathiella sedimenti]
MPSRSALYKLVRLLIKIERVCIKGNYKMSAGEEANGVGKMTTGGESHQINVARLDSWMRENIEDYTGPLQVTKFADGQSNPTFKIETNGDTYVLRRKPIGNLVASAHAVDREFRVISALQAQGFLVPRTYALCMDDSVIGSAFYVMAMIEGRVFTDQLLPDVAFEDRRAIFVSQAETLAKLHSYDPAQIGLADYGKPGNYFERQVRLWQRQYRAAQDRDIPEMEKMLEWLPQSVPTQQSLSIVHGDYKLHNVMFHKTSPKVEAVLDWELSTTGDPLADLSYMLMQWIRNDELFGGLAGVDLAALNIPTLQEMAEIYCNAAGRTEVPDLNWYFAFNMFRLAGISQGIVGRIKAGNASSEKAHIAAGRIVPLAKSAWEYAQKAGAK